MSNICMDNVCFYSSDHDRLVNINNILKKFININCTEILEREYGFNVLEYNNNNTNSLFYSRTTPVVVSGIELDEDKNFYYFGVSFESDWKPSHNVYDFMASQYNVSYYIVSEEEQDEIYENYNSNNNYSVNLPKYRIDLIYAIDDENDELNSEIHPDYDSIIAYSDQELLKELHDSGLELFDSVEKFNQFLSTKDTNLHLHEFSTRVIDDSDLLKAVYYKE